MTTKKWFGAACVAAMAAAALLVGCDESSSPRAGALALRWSAGPAASCEAADLARVEVELRRGRDTVERMAFPCSDGGAFVDALDPGRYDVTLHGVDATGLRTFVASLGRVQVVEGAHVDLGTVRLDALPAQIQLQWFFANGKLCSQNQVEKIEVAVYDDEYYRIDSAEFGCAQGHGTLAPLPAGGYELEVTGFSNGGLHARARSVVALHVGRGEDVLVEVPLEQM